MARDPGGSLRRSLARVSNGVGSGGSPRRSDDTGSDQPTLSAAASSQRDGKSPGASAERQPLMGRATAPLYRLRSRHSRTRRTLADPVGGAGAVGAREGELVKDTLQRPDLIRSLPSCAPAAAAPGTGSPIPIEWKAV